MRLYFAEGSLGMRLYCTAWHAQCGVGVGSLSCALSAPATLLSLPVHSIMYQGIYSVPLVEGESEGPVSHLQPSGAFLYFLIYMVIMTFFLLQLFIGFLIVTFQEIGVRSFRETKLDRNQVGACCLDRCT